MAADDSMDDDVFESQEDIDSLKVAGKKGNTPSPTGYRDYKPPAEVLKLCQTDVLEDCEQIVHKVLEPIGANGIELSQSKLRRELLGELTIIFKLKFCKCKWFREDFSSINIKMKFSK